LKVIRILIALSTLALGVVAAVPEAAAQEQCVPFGGTIYGWHSDAWYGVGDFTVGKDVMFATIVDPNTGFTDQGDIWLGTEEATFTFKNGDKITAMTEFVTEHMTDSGGGGGVYHVNETGYFSKGTGRFKHAWGRFSLQGPFGPGVALPANISVPDDPNKDGWFWIGQYNGTICGVSVPDSKTEKEKD
jgi:hypothetical protein